MIQSLSQTTLYWNGIRMKDFTRFTLSLIRSWHARKCISQWNVNKNETVIFLWLDVTNFITISHDYSFSVWNLSDGWMTRHFLFSNSRIMPRSPSWRVIGVPWQGNHGNANYLSRNRGRRCLASIVDDKYFFTQLRNIAKFESSKTSLKAYLFIKHNI